ncbi:glutathione S-transferase family protein [Aliidiomarina sanyensis]|uniref:Glutathione S-transferase n=1 Tax=Aliidiomarina sanyensis TaxID=1249555 RepID=A0A432WBT2_9GAMM|nr:glutathione S-transferase family protein [Aliidiomarina sanyensis]RUO29513.1 glutathione S-transferase [Aliidiomarina sanyensis]
MIRLFGSFTSPFVRHCRIALAQAGLPYEFVETNYQQSAQGSPTQRVPYLEWEETKLTDSTSILKFIRAQQSQDFLPSLAECELYATANTLLDTTINLFLLEKDGCTPDNTPYLARQLARLGTTLENLNGQVWPTDHKVVVTDDGMLRLCCYLDWVLFRNRLDLTPYPNLLTLLKTAQQNPTFTASAPPQ